MREEAPGIAEGLLSFTDPRVQCPEPPDELVEVPGPLPLVAFPALPG